jgi:hypothetical protein
LYTEIKNIVLPFKKSKIDKMFRNKARNLKLVMKCKANKSESLCTCVFIDFSFQQIISAIRIQIMLFLKLETFLNLEILLFQLEFADNDNNGQVLVDLKTSSKRIICKDMNLSISGE